MRRRAHACQIADSPTALHRLDHIVAGHTVQGKEAMLGADGLLYKPVQKGEKGRREVAFYELAASPASACPRLKPFLPSYFGTCRFDSLDYLAMEDIAIQFKEPCVLDLKLGVRTYEPDATQEKIASELRKCPAQAAVGFRPCGMRVYGTRSRRYRCRDKDWGRRITTETAPTLLAEFVCDDDAQLSIRRISRVVPPLLRRLRELEVAMCEQRGLRFYASSIVVVYEGSDEAARAGEEAAEGGAAAIDLRIVDFAHWVRVEASAGVDDNLITGLRAVIGLFEHIAREPHAYAQHVEGAAAAQQPALEPAPAGGSGAAASEPAAAGEPGVAADSLQQTPPQPQRAVGGLSRRWSGAAATEPSSSSAHKSR